MAHVSILAAKGSGVGAGLVLGCGFVAAAFLNHIEILLVLVHDLVAHHAVSDVALRRFPHASVLGVLVHNCRSVESRLRFGDGSRLLPGVSIGWGLVLSRVV